MNMWNKIADYDKQKDYRRQDEMVMLPELNKEVLFFYQNYQNPKRRPFIGCVKLNEDGIPKIYETILGGEMFNIENGIQWLEFERPE